jgi:hypothetical protein
MQGQQSVALNAHSLSLLPPTYSFFSLTDCSTLKMEVIRSSETSVHKISTRRHIPEDGILVFFFYLHLSLCLSVRNHFRIFIELWFVAVVSSSGYAVSRDWIIVNKIGNYTERGCCDLIWNAIRVLSRKYWGKQRTRLSQDSGTWSRDLNQNRPVYEVGVVLTRFDFWNTRTIRAILLLLWNLYCRS